ncbi:phage tail protein [Pseudomonas yamanorum]|nr:phage tail protein [Pseudomonas yamanorum]
MGASITLAGESLIAQKLGAQQSLIVTRFVLANVPGLDPNKAVDRTAGKPAIAQIVGTFDVTQKGFVNPNQVVYSLMIGSDIGDFDFNWIGLETSENVLLAVAYLPVQQKRRNIPPLQLGNNVTRNFLVVFDGAQALTGLTIDASTWQHDFTVRLAGIDERERLSNRDVYGRACFHGSALELEKAGNAYQLKPGIAYVEGIRLERKSAQPVAVPSIPNKAWLDVVLQRELSDVVGTFQVVFGTGKEDYTDSAGARHYLVPLADLPSTSVITDLRAVEPIASELIKHLAARTGDYPKLRARGTEKEDVGLDQIPNAISDDAESNKSDVLATTKMVNAVRTLLNNAIKAIVDGTTAAGKATQLVTARTFKFRGAATGNATFDGTADPDIVLTLADSGVAAGGYTKVTVNVKGLVTAGSNPTTLGGYGITDAYTRTDAYNAFVKQGGGIGQSSNRVYIGWSPAGLKATVDELDLGRIWSENNFNPSNKADKATTLGGYGITDAYTIDQTNQQINYRVIRDSITYAGFASNDVTLPYFRRESDGQVYYLQPRLGFTPIQQGTGIGQLTNIVKIGWAGNGGLKLTVDSSDLGNFWYSGNFNPDQKANWGNSLAAYGITNAYTIEQTNQQLLLRTVGDAVSTVGFASGNSVYPYFRHKDNGQVYYLQPQLGFTPVEQGGGSNQSTNKIRYGWDSQGRGMRVQVDTTDMGIQWSEQTFYRPDSSNFLAVAGAGTSVQLPAGGTWCYSLMHYAFQGNGITGKSGQAAGGTVISFSGGNTIYGFAWRYAP